MDHTNSIERLFMEVNTTSLKSAYGFKDAIDEYVNNDLLPLLENYLAGFPQLQQQQVNLEFLEFTIDVNQKDWQFELRTQWERQIHEHLGSHIQQHTTKRDKGRSDAKEQEPLLYFLKQGVLPWWVEIPQGSSSMDAWIYKQLESDQLRRKLIAQLGLPEIRTRLIKQFKDGFLLSLLENTDLRGSYWSPQKKHVWSSFLKGQKRTVRHLTWEILLLLHTNQKKIPQHSKNQFTALYKAELLKKESKKTQALREEFVALSKQSLNPSASELISILAKDLLPKSSIASSIISTAKTSDIEPSESQENDANKEIIDGISANSAKEETAKQTTSQEHLSAIDKKFEEIQSVEKSEEKPDKKLQEQLNKVDSKDDTQKLENTQAPVSDDEKNDRELINKEDLQVTKIQKDEIEATEKDVAEATETFNEISESKELLLSGFENKQNMDKAIYMPHCGFLLIHPFLSAFLKNCELLTKNGKLKDKIEAAELLYYTATGQQSAYEHQMLFFKFLCDIPQGYPLNRTFELSDELKAKSDELLEAVIGHMPQLGSSSIDLLRNEFLMREGKLILGETNKIIVSRKTQDLLLQNIPWNLSVIKLPWLKKLTYMEW